jgi:hypothetical protein
VRSLRAATTARGAARSAVWAAASAAAHAARARACAGTFARAVAAEGWMAWEDEETSDLFWSLDEAARRVLHRSPSTITTTKTPAPAFPPGAFPPGVASPAFPPGAFPTG